MVIGIVIYKHLNLYAFKWTWIWEIQRTMLLNSTVESLIFLCSWSNYSSCTWQFTVKIKTTITIAAAIAARTNVGLPENLLVLRGANYTCMVDGMEMPKSLNETRKHNRPNELLIFFHCSIKHAFHLRSPSGPCQNVRFNGLNRFCLQRRTANRYRFRRIRRFIKIFNTNVTDTRWLKSSGMSAQPNFWRAAQTCTKYWQKNKNKPPALELIARAFVYGCLCW